MKRPQPTGVEKTFGDNEFIVSKTDLKGKITYGNDLFIRMSGYSEDELLGAPHNILRHPEMPRAVFKLLWEKIQAGEEIFAYVKNLCKDGASYWVFAHVTPSVNDKGQIIGYHSVRRKPKREAIQTISSLYRQMIVEESRGGMEAGRAFLMKVVEEKGVSYDEFILTL